MALIRGDIAQEVMRMAEDIFSLTVSGSGIVFTVPLASLCGRKRADILRRNDNDNILLLLDGDIKELHGFLTARASCVQDGAAPCALALGGVHDALGKTSVYYCDYQLVNDITLTNSDDKAAEQPVKCDAEGSKD